jgi:hypothetical protein
MSKVYDFMEFWNIFICEDRGHYHFCGDLYKQLILLDEYRVFCGVRGYLVHPEKARRYK